MRSSHRPRASRNASASWKRRSLPDEGAEPDTIDVLAAQLQLANARNQSLEEDLASVRALLEARSAQPAASIAEAGPSTARSILLRSEVDRMVSLFDASARAVSELAAARDSGELLKELVKRLSMQFSRVALPRERHPARRRGSDRSRRIGRHEQARHPDLGRLDADAGHDLAGGREPPRRRRGGPLGDPVRRLAHVRRRAPDRSKARRW